MSNINSSADHLTLNADGAGKEIKFQANGVEKASIDSSGNFTSTSIDATKLSGTVPNFTSTGIDDNATSTAITIDASENVGIGVVPETSNKTGDLHGVWGSIGGWSNTMFFNNNAYYNSGWKYKNTALASSYESKDGKHIFLVAPSGTADSAISWTTAMTIDNGGHVVIPGGTQASTWTTGSGGVRFLQSSTYGIEIQNSRPSSATGTQNILVNYHNASYIGGINTTTSGTQFLTSSDYRLKEDAQPMVGSIDRLKALNPINFAWKLDGSRTDGFLAHEAGEVVPECVSGTKDAMMDEEYEVTPAVMDGETVVTEAVMGTRSVPDYQGIDQSKLVPLLVASLQEAVAKIEALDARVTALEV